MKTNELSVIPKDLIKEYLSNEEITEAVSAIGENRGQFFVRIPVKIAERLHIQKTNKIRFIVRGKADNIKLEVDVVKNEMPFDYFAAENLCSWW